MKYIDSDKLIAEIERRLKDYWEISFHNVKAYGEDSNVRELRELRSFITSLQQEQPEVELDREIIKYKVPFTDEREYLNETTLDAIARHFYKLGLNAKKYE